MPIRQYRRAFLFLALLGLGFSSRASQDEKSTRLFLLLSASNDEKYTEIFQQLSTPEKEEAWNLFQTELPSWSAISEAPKAFFEKNPLSSFVLKKNLRDWLFLEKQTANIDHLRYVELSQFPVLSKIKFEKKSCETPSLEENNKTPSSQDYLCSLREKIGVFRCSKNTFLGSVKASKNCDPTLELSVAVDLLGDKGLYEENFLKIKRSQFISQISRENDWNRIRKALWLSLEHLYTKIPKFVESLPARQRLVELSDNSLDAKSFLHKKELFQILEKGKPQTEPPQPSVSVVSALKTGDASEDYEKKIKGISRAGFESLERNESPLTYPTSLFYKKYQRMMKESLRSYLLAKLDQKTWVLSKDQEKIKYQTVRYYTEWTQKNYFNKIEFQREKKNIQKIGELLEILTKELRNYIPLASGESELFETLKFQNQFVHTVQATLQEKLLKGQPPVLGREKRKVRNEDLS